MTYYKWLEKDDTTCGFAWPLPTQNEDGSWTPGEWVDVSNRGPMNPCSRTALHACGVRDLAKWVKGGDLFVIEFDGEAVDNGDKVCGQRARLLRRITVSDETKHLWACEIAEDALMREREAGREPDPRSLAGIEAKRRWLRGEISDDDLAEARDAAWDAAMDAAWAAARAEAMDAAWDAARDAARDAAWAAARAEAWDAARAEARAEAMAEAWTVAHLRYGEMLLRLIGEGGRDE